MGMESLVREGRLAEALAGVQDAVRREPADPRHRVLLFQLLCVLGEWKRAVAQLRTIGELDAGALPMVQTYREALRCELFREAVFAGRRTPLVFGRPEPWVALLVEALRHDAEGRHDAAQGLRDRAFDAARAVPGRLGDQPFAWIADADPRLGPVLEAVVDGRYWWIPFEHVRRLRIEAPADLRDLVWMPAHFQWANAGESVGLVPTRYPGSAAREDAALRLGRRTEWVEVAPDLHVGLGQRMLATDAAEFPLMDIRDIVLEGGAEAPAPAGDG